MLLPSFRAPPLLNHMGAHFLLASGELDGASVSSARRAAAETMRYADAEAVGIGWETGSSQPRLALARVSQTSVQRKGSANFPRRHPCVGQPRVR